MLNIPNLLSLSRLPLAAVLFAAIHCQAWLLGLIVFAIAAITDWADGYLARRWKQQTAIGRSLDPLTDKVLLNGAFIFFIPVAGAGIAPWMVAVIVGRELLVTGIRGMVEATGAKFAADWFGKLKTILQFATIFEILFAELVFSGPKSLILEMSQGSAVRKTVEFDLIGAAFLWAMLIATVGSGVQYCAKAARVLSS